MATLEELILAHPRYRLQPATLFERWQASLDRVPADGETLVLAVAGNHAQGCIFRDGAHLITPELEERVDQIAKAFDGFYFGRFDVRYSDPEAFRRGEDFGIVELNGATSESTNIYEPDASGWFGYRTRYRQWSLMFQIGYACRNLGYPAVSPWRLIPMIREFEKNQKTPLLVAD